MSQRFTGFHSCAAFLAWSAWSSRFPRRPSNHYQIARTRTSFSYYTGGAGQSGATLHAANLGGAGHASGGDCGFRRRLVCQPGRDACAAGSMSAVRIGRAGWFSSPTSSIPNTGRRPPGRARRDRCMSPPPDRRPFRRGHWCRGKFEVVRDRLRGRTPRLHRRADYSPRRRRLRASKEGSATFCSRPSLKRRTLLDPNTGHIRRRVVVLSDPKPSAEEQSLNPRPERLHQERSDNEPGTSIPHL
jgi:hypothetical protein